ncbi:MULTISPECIES: restriction endonuclease subunit S [Acinetobacter]|uniref:restriction endonuclease subunit S n=1 Tax=Acinetobacter TaxID=469 RepID=UPI0005C545EE|nr:MULTISPECIES: restriction endonuclease subunit S [Acinetobacter]
MAAPKLRFKEFDGDWKQETLKNLATFSKGKGISKADISEDGINLCIRYGELYTTYGQVIDHIQSKTNVSKSECVLSKAGDVIIPASGETQIDIATASCVLRDDIILSGDLNILSHHENGEWLAYYLSSAKKLEIAQLAQGNSVVHLYSSQLKDLKINKPSKEEQTKIASFLSAVDEKISQLTQKHELLSQYKQGMMQKLFSQQVRFKADDGSEFGEWEELKFKEVIKIKYGKDHKKLDDGDIPVLGTGGIMRYVDSYLYDGESILIGRKGTIDKPQFISGKFWTVDTLFYTEIGKKILPKFAFQQLLLVNWLNLNEATGVPSLNTTSIGNIELKVPSLKEQTKIANFLSAIDQKIEVVAQQIEQAKQWKKGLLQQMFV